MQRQGEDLAARARTWLVTGAAGFIGSHLVESLLALGQHVRGFDNLSTGCLGNLDEVRASVGPANWARFRFEKGDLRDGAACARAVEGVDIVSHQAALGSVSRSIEHPLEVLDVNVGGFLALALAARDAGCERFLYASSSSVYGNHPALPKREDVLGDPLSPYAASKRTDELLAAALHASDAFPMIGLRYFNVFGPRQNPAGPYAAVIPIWCLALMRGERPRIFGDGSTSRDFTPVRVAVQANLLAAGAGSEAFGSAFNVALGARTSLLTLYRSLERMLGELSSEGPSHADFRAGDVLHSHADLGRAREVLGLEPCESFEQGLERTVLWFQARAKEDASFRPPDGAR